MNLTHRMEQQRTRGFRIVLGSVTVLAFALGTAFGNFVLPLTANQQQVASQTMTVPGAADLAAPNEASSKAPGPWELYHCEGCPDADGRALGLDW